MERGASGFDEVHRWSVDRPDEFWLRAWNDLGVVGDRGTTVLEGQGFRATRFFPEARLNVVDTLLAGPDDDVVLVSLD